MTKLKAERGKKLDKGLNETKVQLPPELAEQATAAPESGETDTESNILLAIRSMSKTMTDRFDKLGGC